MRLGGKRLRIAVVGYGTGRQASALLLSRDGHQVEVFERAPVLGPVGAGFLLQPIGRVPEVGPNDALVRITTTIICGNDIHILKGEYPMAKDLTIGHEPVGVIEKLGRAVTGYREDPRVIAGAICPNFNSYAAQDGVPSTGRQLPDRQRALPWLQGHGWRAPAGTPH